MDGAATLDGAFARPVIDAQGVFRVIMDAMARPGQIRVLSAMVRPPLPLSPAAGAVALALCDHDAPIWLDPLLASSAGVAEWLGFHTGAPVVGRPSDAHFALISRPVELDAFDRFAQGSQEYPDRSTTLILQVADFVSGTPFRLDGPGVNGVARIAPKPMPADFMQLWGQNRSRFPRGVDLILTGQDAIACIPRSTKVSDIAED